MWYHFISLPAGLFYSKMQRYLLTPEQLVDNGYPQATGRVGVASINWGRDAPTIQPVGVNGELIQLLALCVCDMCVSVSVCECECVCV